MRLNDLFCTGKSETLPINFFYLVSTTLVLIGTVYLAHGCYGLFTEAGDYKMRWVEQQYVFQGKNPIDIFEREQAQSLGKPQKPIGRDTTIDPKLGPTAGVYPPWAYFTGAAFTWTRTFEVGRFIYGIWNFVLLAGILTWAYKLGCQEDLRLGLLFVTSVFAMNSICTTFVVGQYGIIVLAALIAAYLFEEKGHFLGSGICLGIALTKISLAGPFLLPFLIKMRWRTVLVALAYLGLGSLVIWPMVKTNPIEMLGQMLHSSESHQFGYSMESLFEFLGVGIPLAMKSSALISLGFGIIILYIWRSESMLLHYAIAAVVARAWCYHAMYDNLILIFLLLALGITAWRTNKMVAILGYVSIGFTLWMPARLGYVHAWMPVQWLAWTCGGAVLLLQDKTISKSGLDIAEVVPSRRARLGNKVNVRA